MLDRPVLLVETPPLILNAAMSSPAPPLIIGERVVKHGYSDRIAFCSIGNWVTSDFTALVGPDHGRRQLRHGLLITKSRTVTMDKIAIYSPHSTPWAQSDLCNHSIDFDTPASETS